MRHSHLPPGDAETGVTRGDNPSRRRERIQGWLSVRVDLPRVAPGFPGLLRGASLALPMPFDVRRPIAGQGSLVLDDDLPSALGAVAGNDDAAVRL